MKKQIILTMALLSIGVISSEAMAVCSGTQVTGVALTTLLQGNTICAGSPGNWESQEFHAANGDVIDYKKGANDPVDPSTKVGTYVINGNNVTYHYGTNTYTYTVYGSGTSYSYCGGNPTQIDVTLKIGQGAC